MTKTIEEVAKRFADMKTTKQAGSSVERDKKALLMTQFFHFALEELPLSSRLTAEEKEMVRKMYKEAVEGKCELEKMQPQNTYAKNSIAMRIGVNMGCILTLKSIFGSDLFKEED